MDDNPKIIKTTPAEKQKSDVSRQGEYKESVNPSPQEVYDQLTRYLGEVDNLLSGLREGLIKGEEQLRLIRAFDERVTNLGAAIDPIETTSVENEVESIRKHILLLQEMRDQLKVDIENVKRIGEKITEILGQYYQTSKVDKAD